MRHAPESPAEDSEDAGLSRSLVTAARLSLKNVVFPAIYVTLRHLGRSGISFLSAPGNPEWAGSNAARRGFSGRVVRSMQLSAAIRQLLNVVTVATSALLIVNAFSTLNYEWFSEVQPQTDFNWRWPTSLELNNQFFRLLGVAALLPLATRFLALRISLLAEWRSLSNMWFILNSICVPTHVGRNARRTGAELRRRRKRVSRLAYQLARDIAVLAGYSAHDWSKQGWIKTTLILNWAADQPWYPHRQERASDVLNELATAIVEKRVLEPVSGQSPDEAQMPRSYFIRSSRLRSARRTLANLILTVLAGVIVLIPDKAFDVLHRK